MKNSKKMFILTEAVLAALVVFAAFVMLKESRGDRRDRIAVVVRDSDNSRWAAFKYGLRMAADDFGVEVFVVSTEKHLGVKEEQRLLEEQIAAGAAALIVQPSVGDGAQELLTGIEKRVPLMLVGGVLQASGEETGLPVTEADNYAMGERLAQELLQDYSGNLKGKTIGLLSETVDSLAASERERGFRAELFGSGARILWSVTGSDHQFEADFVSTQAEADFVVAMDDASLKAAGALAASNDLRGALVYGIGSSTEAVYYLDAGNVECLIVPDDFSIGYQSLAQTAKKLEQFFFYEMQDQVVSYEVLRQENLFSEEYQEILFTMNQ